MDIFVQFSDQTETTVISVFGCAQDATQYPNQGVIPYTDARYIAFVSPELTLPGARAARIDYINQACSAQIMSGFQSSALGAVYTYPSNMIDQNNMNVNVTSSLFPNLPPTWTTEQMCCDSNGIWAYRLHTAAQIQQAGDDGKAAILPLLMKVKDLRTQIEAATTVAEVNAIVW